MLTQLDSTSQELETMKDRNRKVNDKHICVLIEVYISVRGAGGCAARGRKCRANARSSFAAGTVFWAWHSPDCISQEENQKMLVEMGPLRLAAKVCAALVHCSCHHFDV